MMSKLPCGTPESARSFIRLLKILETKLSLEDAQQLDILAKSMIEVTMIWQKLLANNGNTLPPEWNAEQDLKHVNYRCDDKLFSQVGRAVATVLTDLLQVIDLDIQNLTEIERHLKNTFTVKEELGHDRAEQQQEQARQQEKENLASCRNQDEVRRLSLEELELLRQRKKEFDAEELRIQRIIDAILPVRPPPKLQESCRTNVLIPKLELEFLWKNMRKNGLAVVHLSHDIAGDE